MRRLLLILCLLFLFSTALLLLTVRYRADDLEELARVQAGGPLANVTYYWQFWSGRWAYALVTGQMKLLPEAWAGLPLIGILALWAWSCWKLGREWGLAVLCATLLLAPNLAESLFWQSGATAYSLPLALFSLLLVCAKSQAPAAVLVAGSAIVAGLGDTIRVAQIAACAILLCLYPSHRRSLLAMTVGGLAGFSLVQLAPGNAYRAAFFPTPDLWLALPFAARACLQPMVNAIRRVPLAVVLYAAPFGLRRRRMSTGDEGFILIVLLGIIVLNFSTELAAFYTTSGPLAPRSEIVPLFGTLAGLALILKTVLEGSVERFRL